MPWSSGQARCPLHHRHIRRESALVRSNARMQASRQPRTNVCISCVRCSTRSLTKSQHRALCCVAPELEQNKAQRSALDRLAAALAQPPSRPAAMDALAGCCRLKASGARRPELSSKQTCSLSTRPAARTSRRSSATTASAAPTPGALASLRR